MHFENIVWGIHKKNNHIKIFLAQEDEHIIKGKLDILNSIKSK